MRISPKGSSGSLSAGSRRTTIGKENHYGIPARLRRRYNPCPVGAPQRLREAPDPVCAAPSPFGLPSPCSPPSASPPSPIWAGNLRPPCTSGWPEPSWPDTSWPGSSTPSAANARPSDPQKHIHRRSRWLSLDGHSPLFLADALTRNTACQLRKDCYLLPVNGLDDGILNCSPSSSSFN